MADLWTPDELTLRLFLLGRLAGPEAERVERYLESRPEAASTLQGLHSEDTLTASLRGQAAAAEEVSADVRAAMHSLERLARPKDGQTTPHGTGEDSQADPSDSGDSEDITEDSLSFLSPARGPGELGWL
ncbi:MAG: hypothetical protein J2P46_07530, partial [Zavarzinella sp.]|nr:hypothetical protein [Zavarzinella sp.]